MLVHDAWHGAWAWQRVVQTLNEAKERLDVGEVLAPDLPGHGHSPFTEIRVITQEQYMHAVVTPVQVKRLSEVVLVGHGFAGTFLPQVALELGSAVKRVVFIAGLLPPEGQTPYATLSLPLKLLVRSLRPREKGVTFPRLVYRRMFRNGLDGDLAKEVMARLVPDPYLPWTVPATRDGFIGMFPTSYLVLTHDRAIPPPWQRRYASSLGHVEVVEIAAGHEAPLTMAAEIAQLLLRYARDA